MNIFQKFKTKEKINKIKIIKKQEVFLVALAVFLMIVGFVSYKPNSDDNYGRIADVENYSESTIGEATLVSSNSIENTSNEVDNTSNEMDNTSKNEIIQTASEEKEYFLEEKMERDKIYSESIEIYEEMLESSTITNEQKAIAQNEITNITNEKKTIQISENLIKMKGFKDVIILKNDTGISVIVKSDVLLPEQVAQIQNIIEREFQTDSKNISITNK